MVCFDAQSLHVPAEVCDTVLDLQRSCKLF